MYIRLEQERAGLGESVPMSHRFAGGLAPERTCRAVFWIGSATLWTVRESVRAKLRTAVKRLLRKYGYPPDKEEKATQTVIEQAEVLSREWAA